jgi:type VI secretion system protein ImpG
MFNNYYQQQLARLRTRAAEFARAHPAIAPLLAEASEDPDVERLLEGTAFLCGMLQQKIDDDFPEYIHNLTEIIFPHLLRPIPSASIVAFTPKDSLLETLPIPAGTMLSSIPVEGTRCEFRTSLDVRLLPLQVAEVGTRRISTAEESVFVKLRLSGISLAQWQEDALPFYIAGDFSQTSNMFMRLRRSTRRIVVRTPSGGSIALGPEHLRTPGFDCASSICPMPNQSFRGYSLLIDYFVFPEKFLFLEITGLSSLKDKGDGDEFEIEFVLSAGRTPLEVRKEYFTLFATPVVNLFSHDADPIQVNHQSEAFAVLPSGFNKSHFNVYTVDSVVGLLQGMVETKTYVPFNRYRFHDAVDTGVFQVHHVSKADGRHAVELSLAYRPDEQLRQEVLSIQLTCSNGHLAERLRVGDINVPTSSSPELATFRNIVAPTPFIDIAVGKNELWRLLAHVSQNLLSIDDAEAMREFLHLYTFDNQRSDHRAIANRKRVQAVEAFSTTPVDRIVRRILMRGIQIRMTAADRDFAGEGDLYLFGSVLDAFLSMYAAMNTFTQFELTNSQTGERFLWTPRLGEKPLL